MQSLRTPTLLVCLSVVGVSSLFAVSDICRFTLPGAVEGRWDMEVILFHRDGAFHHGCALVPRRDEVVHRVDVTPSRPIQWQKADGTPLEVPERMRGYYSYKLTKEFAEYKRRHASGEIEIAHPFPAPPVAWKDGKLTGLVDVLIAPANVANSTGRGPLDTAYRIRVDARGRMGGPLTGRASWWTYESKDDDYGAGAERTTVKLEDARWDADYWKPAEGTSYARGSDWPQMAGSSCGRPRQPGIPAAGRCRWRTRGTSTWMTAAGSSAWRPRRARWSTACLTSIT